MTAEIQKPAPDFKAMAMINGEFKELQLSDYRGKYLVLLFYPKDFTFVCPTELIAFGDRIEEFRKLNAEVIGVSVDTEYVHLAWWKTARNEGGSAGIQMPLIADVTRQMCIDYDVLLDEGVALRGAFVIDPEGTLRQKTVNDLPVGRNVDETLRVIEALQFNAEHGEVCPANWTPGAATITPEPEASKSYFSSVS